jgi:hypothetical protein
MRIPRGRPAMSNARIALATAITVALAGLATAQGAEIVPVIFDDPGEGYFDATPVAPVGGNPGTTRGEQRRIVAEFAADLWGAVLESNQPVFVGAQFNPLGPNVLGSAGATFIFRDFPNAPVAGTWYSSALADAISGQDLQPGFIDINSQFSSDFSFYYGLDGQTPAGQINFLDVVMHEYGHGLGFQNFASEATGKFQSNTPDIYSTFTFDNTTGKFWTQMNNPERRASAVNYGNVVFTGERAVTGAELVLDDRQDFLVTAPAAIAGAYAYGTASFGPAISPMNFAGSVVLGTNAGSASPSDGCTALTNGAAVSGNIALLDRGSCNFTVKVKNAQNAGATGVLIADNVAGTPPPGMSGVDPTITIPSIRISLAEGNAIKANLPGVAVAFVVDPGKLQGADDDGRPRLFMPDPVQGGSSGSHYDSNALPNALMEPAINSTLLSIYNLDLTPALLADTGWSLNDGDAQIEGCDTGIDVVDDAGIIIGANVQATHALCLAGAGNRGAYIRCMDGLRDRLVDGGLISGAQGDTLMDCATDVGK